MAVALRGVSSFARERGRRHDRRRVRRFDHVRDLSLLGKRGMVRADRAATESRRGGAGQLRNRNPANVAAVPPDQNDAGFRQLGGAAAARAAMTKRLVVGRNVIGCRGADSLRLKVQRSDDHPFDLIRGSEVMRTQVVIVGSGPSVLGQLLANEGIDTIILEQKSKDYVLGRIRAGVLEEGAVRLIEQAGAAERLHREGLIHDGTEIAFDGVRHRIDFKGLAGKTVTLYGRPKSLATLWTRARRSALRRCTKRWTSVCTPLRATGLASASARTEPFRRSNATNRRLRRLSRREPQGHSEGALSASIPSGGSACSSTSRRPPRTDYVNHERGFALCSMRSTTRAATTSSARVDEHVEDWPDDKFWEELTRRLDPEAVSKLSTGPRSKKSIAPCAVSLRNRCGSATCFSQATPPISCRRQEPRG